MKVMATSISGASATLLLATLCASAQPAANKAEELRDPAEIVRRSIERSRGAWQALRDYTFIQTTENRRKDGDGKVTKTESETEEVLIIEGQPFTRVIARNGKPLSGEEQRKERERMDAEIKKRLGETPEQRAGRLKAYEEDRMRRGAILDEIPKAFDFKLAGSEIVDGRPVYVVEAYPKPGYHGLHKYSKYLPKLKGKLWIDKEDYHWAKLEAESIDTVSVGWILARIQEGSKLVLLQKHVGPDTWFPQRVSLDATLRILLVKRMGMEVITQFSDYKKFQADSRVVATQELPQ